MIQFKDVSKTYPNGTKALSHVDITIEKGEFVFIVGESGAGKSTLIKLLLKEVPSTVGTVMVNGYNLNKIKRRKIPVLRRTIGVVFQDYRLIPTLTVYENIAFVLRVIDASARYIRKRVPQVIEMVGLQDKARAYPRELSGGEQQRVALARALANDPMLIIADEPTGNLDPELSYEITDMLKEINKSGTTVLMVTHDHNLVLDFGGRVVRVEDGSITFDGIVEGEHESK